MSIDEKLEEKILSEYKQNKRGYLDKLRGKDYAHIKQYLWERFPMLQDKNYSFGMRLYWLESGLNDFPDCEWTEDGVHPNTTTRCGIKGYRTTYCCPDCASKGGAKKTRAVKADRYGDPYWHNPEKTAKTNKKRYGCANPFANPDIVKRIQKKRKKKSKQLMKKAWETRRKNDPIGSTRKYYEIGIPRTYKYAAQFPKEVDQLFLEWLDWSGIKDFEVRKYTKSERAFIKRRFKQYKQLQQNKFKPNFSLEDWIKCEDPWEEEMNWICPEGHYFKDRYKPHYGLEHLRCPTCNPYLGVGTSAIEKELIALVEALVGYECIKNSRDIIKPLELDLFDKEKKVAFEMDGMYQHCDINKSKHYHQLKTNMCKKLGIQLVHVFEDEWKTKQEICKSYIKQALGLNKKKNATQLQLKKISREDAQAFFAANCILEIDIRREVASYGLFDSDQMLFVCSFAHLKANKYEVIGFCNALSYEVLGAIDFISEQFKRAFEPSYIRCKVDRRFYSELNFSDCKNFGTQFLEKIDFYYVNYGYKYKVREWQVDEEFLKQLKTYDLSKSVEENLANNKFAKIYDSGQIVFTWKK